MKAVHGLVVCGGKSSRMGRDKCTMTYHENPQWQHLAGLMEPLCQRVSISISASQEGQFKSDHPIIVDDSQYANCGPMAALLTAFLSHPTSPLLFVGCDYPLLTASELQRLLDARMVETDAVCFYNEESQFDEPLLAVYEPSIQPTLIDGFKNSEFSLRKILQKVRAHRILPFNSHTIVSSNTPEEAQFLIDSIKASNRLSANFDTIHL